MQPTNTETRHKLETRQALEKLNELVRQKQHLQRNLAEVWQQALELQQRIAAIQAEYDKRILEVTPLTRAHTPTTKSKPPSPEKELREKLIDKMSRDPRFEQRIRDELGIY